MCYNMYISNYNIYVKLPYMSLHMLFVLDPLERSSVEQALTHTYLLYGPDARDGPPSLTPLTLHHSTPTVTLPTRSNEDACGAGEGGGGGGGESADDQLWARRQFSVLWAPMPTAYTSDKVSQINVKLTELFNVISLF